MLDEAGMMSTISKGLESEENSKENVGVQAAPVIIIDGNNTE